MKSDSISMAISSKAAAAAAAIISVNQRAGSVVSIKSGEKGVCGSEA